MITTPVIVDEMITYIPLEAIVYNRYQPRTQMDPDELTSLAESIRAIGLAQKPMARANIETGEYELAFGHRRYEAYKLLAEQDPAYKTMPIIVRELTDQQMFDLAWDENNDRENLNPLDEANAYAIYMREFGKTSKETSEYFSRGGRKVAEETVRAKLRLLNLNPVAQEKMRAGVINETTGRALLQLQKIAPAEKVTAVISRIEKEAGNTLPEDVIEEAVDRLDNTVELSDQRGIWPLNMKKFPNHLLPQIHEEIARAYKTQLEHLANPPACNVCPFYTKLRGNEYCGLRVCFDRKHAAYEAHMVELTSKRLDIPVYNKEQDGGYVLLAGYEPTHKNVFNKRAEGLRLLPKSHADRYQSQWGFEGLNDDLVFAVATGPALDQLEKTAGARSKGGQKTEKEKGEMRMMKIYRLRRKELLWEFTAAAEVIFEKVPVKAIKRLRSWRFVGVDDRIPDAWLQGKRATAGEEAYFENRQLIWALVVDVCSHYHRESMTAILAKLNKEYASDWGVKIPKSLTEKAAQWDAEIKAAAKPKAAK